MSGINISYNNFPHPIHVANMVIVDCDDAITTGDTLVSQLHIQNNTIIGGQRGITVNYVRPSDKLGLDELTFHESASVQNNLVYDPADYGIRIGRGDLSPFTNTASPWNPPLASGSNNVVPVRNNLVWKNIPAQEFVGDSWYQSIYGITSSRLYGEFMKNQYQPIFVDLGNGDYRLQNSSPGVGLGHPLMVDLIYDTSGEIYKTAPRSLGAYPALPSSTLYVDWSEN